MLLGKLNCEKILFMTNRRLLSPYLCCLSQKELLQAGVWRIPIKKKSAYPLWFSHNIVPDQTLEPEYSQQTWRR